jgi:predicted DNA-binding transcriptional regulator AlpA
MTRPEITGRKLAHRRRTHHFTDSDANADDARALRLLGFKDLKPKKGIPYSRSEIRRKERAGTFPMHVTLGEGDHAYIAWIEHEIDQFIIEKMAARTIATADATATTTKRKTPTPNEEEVRA